MIRESNSGKTIADCSEAWNKVNQVDFGKIVLMSGWNGRQPGGLTNLMETAEGSRNKPDWISIRQEQVEAVESTIIG